MVSFLVFVDLYNILFSGIALFPWLAIIAFGCRIHFTGGIPTLDNIQRLRQEHKVLSDEIKVMKNALVSLSAENNRTCA
ncbi:MAG TPA: hypothetical protein DD408_05270 [Rheinheimera sp.]|nr:hypothetical protein [Rheinheimera sp.]